MLPPAQVIDLCNDVQAGSGSSSVSSHITTTTTPTISLPQTAPSPCSSTEVSEAQSELLVTAGTIPITVQVVAPPPSMSARPSPPSPPTPAEGDDTVPAQSPLFGCSQPLAASESTPGAPLGPSSLTTPRNVANAIFSGPSLPNSPEAVVLRSASVVVNKGQRVANPL